jgi:hypothetical protein
MLMLMFSALVLLFLLSLYVAVIVLVLLITFAYVPIAVMLPENALSLLHEDERVAPTALPPQMVYSCCHCCCGLCIYC